MPRSEVGGGCGGSSGKGHGRRVVAFRQETVYESDLHVFVCDDLHVHYVEVPAEVADARGVLGLIHDTTVIALKSHFCPTAHEVRN